MRRDTLSLVCNSRTSCVALRLSSVKTALNSSISFLRERGLLFGDSGGTGSSTRLLELVCQNPGDCCRLSLSLSFQLSLSLEAVSGCRERAACGEADASLPRAAMPSWSKVNPGSPLGQPWVPDFWGATVGPRRKLDYSGSR